MSEPTSPEPVQAVVIGASAGAVDALLQILPQLPEDYPLALLIVVHLPPDSESTLVELLETRCQITVKEAEDKEILRPGIAYLAPPNYHLLVEPNFELSLSSEEPVLFCRPAIDLLFESAADAFGSSVIGIVLTGANSDGANGLRAIHDAGGAAYVQDPADADAEVMPRAALAACPDAQVLTLAQVIDLLMCQYRRSLLS